MKKLIILLPLALLYSCSLFEKEEEKEGKNLETFVEGRVLTLGTDQKVTSEEIQVNLCRQIARGGALFGGMGEKIIQEGKTDSNGYFYFDFTAESHTASHYLRIPHSQTAPDKHFFNALQQPIEIGVHQTRNIFLSPHAWLKLHIENVNPQPGDEIWINFGGGVEDRYFGHVNVTKIYLLGGNINRSFPYRVYRNNGQTLFRDTVWLPAFDTTYHKIEY
ncbi:MAG: hypothetical protein JJU02_12460 [Cryomorphaceae bacterium]|nr:hypothetical protein [Cryomorphaceae bacterium]